MSFTLFISTANLLLLLSQNHITLSNISSILNTPTQSLYLSLIAPSCPPPFFCMRVSLFLCLCLPFNFCTISLSLNLIFYLGQAYNLCLLKIDLSSFDCICKWMGKCHDKSPLKFCAKNKKKKKNPENFN